MEDNSQGNNYQRPSVGGNSFTPETVTNDLYTPDRNLLYCDIYSIKFVTISESPFIYDPNFQI